MHFIDVFVKPNSALFLRTLKTFPSCFQRDLQVFLELIVKENDLLGQVRLSILLCDAGGRSDVVTTHEDIIDVLALAGLNG